VGSATANKLFDPWWAIVRLTVLVLPDSVLLTAYVATYAAPSLEERPASILESVAVALVVGVAVVVAVVEPVALVVGVDPVAVVDEVVAADGEDDPQALAPRTTAPRATAAVARRAQPADGSPRRDRSELADGFIGGCLLWERSRGTRRRVRELTVPLSHVFDLRLGHANQRS
jgi:hypothetical protein